MTLSEIDNAILAVANERWQKVAMIIGRATKRLGGELPRSDVECDLIAQRIAAVVDDGRLVARGDISRWRHSEVRLP